MKLRFVRNIKTQQAETTLVTGRDFSFKAVSDELIGDQTVIFPSTDAFLFLEILPMTTHYFFVKVATR